MKKSIFVLTAILLSVSTGSAAQTDCHQTLKDMLQGTLDLEREVNNSQTSVSQDAAGGCTLATLVDARPIFTES